MYETKNWFYKKINKVDKSLDRQVKLVDYQKWKRLYRAPLS